MSTHVQAIPRTDPLGESIRLAACSYHHSLSQQNSHSSSSTGTTPLLQQLHPNQLLSSVLLNANGGSSTTAQSSALATISLGTTYSGGRLTRREGALPQRTTPTAPRARPYPAHLAITPSPLRPLCAAGERLTRWKPVSERPSRSGEDRDRILAVLAHAFSTRTLQTYGSGLLVFHAFCDARAVPEVERAPASRDLIALFIATLAGLYSASAVSNYVSGVAAWHTLHRLDWLANQREVDALIKGAAATAPPRRPPRPPFTVDMLQAILLTLSPTSPLDVACAAALTTCFWGTARVAEVVVPNLTAFSSADFVTPADVTRNASRDGKRVTVIHIPRTKCERIHGEDIYWAAQLAPVDPEAALALHMSVNNPGNGEHLFAYRHTPGARRPLTRHAFLTRLKSAAAAAAISLPPGHSIRIGSTTEYLLRGVPFDVMRAKGRWASDAFLKYLRKHAEIMAPYLQANPAVFGDFNRIAMPPVR